MQRREFLRSTCNVCGLLAAGFFIPTLTGCGPAAYKVIHADIKDNTLEIPQASFTPHTPLQVIRPNGWLYSIALRKNEDNTYTALLLKCTHQDNQLIPAAGGSYTCSLHGSTFNTEGRVTKGPAERALRSYPVTTDQNNIIIHLKA